MKRIDPGTVYSASGKVMTVIDRLDDCCLAEGNTGHTFEVFKVNHNAAGKRFGKDFPASESVPPASQWGWPTAVSVVGKPEAEKRLIMMAHHHRTAAAK